MSSLACAARASGEAQAFSSRRRIPVPTVSPTLAIPDGIHLPLGRRDDLAADRDQDVQLAFGSIYDR